mmetsp:Transcript_18669/g.51921  ORF Transcript_18669/g.51921 Transcript_18669/m.51921 type:complete len:132 (-) Transcript_18669:56-451(-)
MIDSFLKRRTRTIDIRCGDPHSLSLSLSLDVPVGDGISKSYINTERCARVLRLLSQRVSVSQAMMLLSMTMTMKAGRFSMSEGLLFARHVLVAGTARNCRSPREIAIASQRDGYYDEIRRVIVVNAESKDD